MYTLDEVKQEIEEYVEIVLFQHDLNVNRNDTNMRIRNKILSTCLSDLEKHPGVWQSFEHKNAIDYFVRQTILGLVIAEK